MTNRDGRDKHIVVGNVASELEVAVSDLAGEIV